MNQGSGLVDIEARLAVGSYPSYFPNTETCPLNYGGNIDGSSYGK